MKNDKNKKDSAILKNRIKKSFSRRSFMQAMGTAGISLGLVSLGCNRKIVSQNAPRDSEGKIIAGFEKSENVTQVVNKIWEPYSDRKLKVGLAGHGFCTFGQAFFFQTHPNVEVVAVTDIDPERCAAMAKATNCKKTYPSCEEMIKDDTIEAVFIATDAPSHCRLAIAALNRGKHVASAVPAVYGNNALEDAENLLEAVKKSGKKYMMYETSTFHQDCYNWRLQYQKGEMGKLIYSEGEYYHYLSIPHPGYNPKNGKVDTNGWRKGMPPMWYATHATGYYISVSGGSFTDVSCLGMPSIVDHLKAENNEYQNPFGTEIALFRTSEGGMSRMAVSLDTNGHGGWGESGRIYSQNKYEDKSAIDMRPALPPGVEGGGHGGSHGHLTANFIESVLLDKKPIVDIIDALNMTIPGVMAHKSAFRNGEWLTVPQYKL